jgi:hypothetical protein
LTSWPPPWLAARPAGSGQGRSNITKITHDAWVRRVRTWELTADSYRDLRLA